MKIPWTYVYPMSVRSQTYQEEAPYPEQITIQALSNEGLQVTMGFTPVYHLNSDAAVPIYKNIGPQYQSVALLTPIHSVPRDVISKYDVKTLYSASLGATAHRLLIEKELLTGIQDKVQKWGIVIELVGIRNIDFDPALKISISQKLQMEQAIAQKNFEVTVAEKEADRKIAEARGIAESNRIISGSLTPNYLRWYWIEALKETEGPTYYIPVGSDGLPIFKEIGNTPE